MADPETAEAPRGGALRQAGRRSSALRVVTDSELQTFRSCHQLHDFKYRQRLRTKVAARPLAVGSIFHGGMAAGIRTGWSAPMLRLSSDSRLAAQVEASARGIDHAVEEWAGTVIAHATDVDYERLAAEVDETAAMVKWMLAHYFRCARGDLSNLLLVEVEHAFSVSMRDATGRPLAHLRYTGVRDAVYYDPGYNALVLDEHKSSGNDPHSIEKRVEMDTQSGGYLHALVEEVRRGGRQLVTTDGTHVPQDAAIGNVRYNVLRKALPRSPSVNKDGSVSVAACVTTPDLYRTALNEQTEQRHIPTSTKQAEFLARLQAQGDPFFARVEWHKTKPDVERWRSDAVYDSRRIREADRDPAARTRNPGNCNMAWSLPCAYRQLCLDPSSTEIRAQFSVADDVHTEVRAAEVDAAP